MRITVWVTERHKALIESQSDEEGLSVSAYMRRRALRGISR